LLTILTDVAESPHRTRVAVSCGEVVIRIGSRGSASTTVSTPIPDPTLDSFDPIDRGILRIGCRGYHCGAECDQRAEPRWRAADLSAIFPAPFWTKQL
jgi:hypothetical protein